MAKKFLTSIDLNGNQLIKPVLENVAANPENELLEGRIAFNTKLNKTIVYDGTNWRELQYGVPEGTYLLSNANAVSATKLVTPRTFSITGGATAEAISFDGSDNVVLDVTAIDPSKITQSEGYRLVTDAERVDWTGKETTTGAQGKADEALTAAKAHTDSRVLTNVPANAVFTDTLYTHPDTHDASMIVESTTKKFVTEKQIGDWDAKETTTGAQAKATAALTEANTYTNGKIGTVNASLAEKSDKTHNHTLASLSEKSYTSLTDTPSLGSVASLNTGTASGNIPILGADGKLDDIVIPKIAISETSVVDSETLMLKLEAEIGDIAIRTDVNKSFILKGDNPKESSNWQELITPTSPVESVAGKTGTVILAKGDVGLSNVDNTSDKDKPVSDAQLAAIGLKVDKVDGKGLSENDYTTAEKTKLSGIAANANNYVHPDDHPASMITQTEKARFVTDKQIGEWDAKETVEGSIAKASSALTDAKAYVNDIVKTPVPENAVFTDTKYTHPDTHPASMITETDDRKFVTPEQIASWTSSEGSIPNGKKIQYFRGDKQWATLDTSAVPELEGGENLYYTDARVKAYSDNVYLGKDGTALKAEELNTARTFSIAGNTGLTATGVTFNGSDHVSLNLTGSLKVANGGTGLTEAKGGFTRKVVGVLNTSATSYEINHGLGSDVIVQVIEVASKEVVECDIIITSENMATIRFNKAPNANAYRYIIIG